MTEEQKLYTEAVASGKVEDILTQLKKDSVRHREQAYCSVNNGFLAHGRRIIPTLSNRLKIQRPERCTHFGTDPMVGMLEWLGREIGKEFAGPEYSGLNLVLGDVAAPKGGCLTGRSGRRSHASHTNGQDADIGFLNVKKNGVTPIQFQRTLDVSTNWWLLGRVFKNPFACIRVIFLDRRHIAALSRYAAKDAERKKEWKNFQGFIRHMPGHGNHFHVRVGDGPGPLGCSLDAQLEEEEEEGDFGDGSDILEEIEALGESSS